MNKTQSTTVPAEEMRFGDFAPSLGAHAELRWFFNDAASEIDTPSSFGALSGEGSPTSVEAVERRAEAVHAAGKINRWLRAVPVGHALLLQGLFSEREWPSVGAWLREVIEQDGREAVADWLREAEVASALAVRAYENVRGGSACVVPWEVG